MNCCDPTIIPFSDSAGMTIPYSQAMKAKYGKIPSVVVYHFENGSYTKANIEIAVDGNPTTQIKFDNGGNASGFIKIYK